MKTTDGEWIPPPPSVIFWEKAAWVESGECSHRLVCRSRDWMFGWEREYCFTCNKTLGGDGYTT